MSRSVKILLWGLAGLIGLLLVAVLVLPPLVDDALLKERVLQTVGQTTGVQPEVGRLDLSLVPWMGVTLHDVTLPQPQGFEQSEPGPLLTAKRLHAEVRWLPLLQGVIALRQVEVERGRVRLMRKADGSTNWQALLGAPNASPPPSTPKQSDQPDWQVVAGGLELKDVQVDFTDAQSGLAATLSGLELESADLAPGSSSSLDLHSDFAVAKPRQVSGSVALKGDLKLGSKLDSAGLEIASLTLDAATKSTTEPVQHANLSGTGSLAVDLETASLALRPLELTAKLSGPALPGGTTEADVASTATLHWNTGDLDLESLRLTAANLTLTATATLKELFTAPQGTAHVEVPTFSPRQFVQQTGLALPELKPGRLESLALTADLAATDGAWTVKPLTLTLDETTLTGDASWQPSADPRLTFDLHADRLAPLEYIPATTKQQTSGEEINPLAVLAGCSAQGTLAADELLLAKATASAVKATVRCDHDQLRIAPFSADIYQGALSGQVSLGLPPASASNAAGTPAPPAMSTPADFRLKAESMQVGPLLHDLVDNQVLSGTGELAMQGSVQGLSQRELLDSLTGTAHVSIRDGVIYGLDLAPTSFDKSKGYTPPQGGSAAEATTPFTLIKADFTIENGKASTKNLSMEGESLHITGKGTADLASADLSGDLTVDLPLLDVPVDLSGRLDDPQASVNAAGMVVNSAVGLGGAIIKSPVTVGKGVLDVGKGVGKGVVDVIEDLAGGGSKQADDEAQEQSAAKTPAEAPKE